MNLRLNTLANMVDVGSRVADIGTDHAYLPIELVKSGKINFAIASDIAAGPLANAKQDIVEAGLEKKIEPRLGAGLDTITKEDQIDTVVIAGMGGKLMTQILNNSWENDLSFDTLILEPNIGECGVREWLIEHYYLIQDEQIIAEAGHIYELIKAIKIKKKELLTREQLYFGPIILKNKNAIFYQKWRGQLLYQKKLLTNLNKAKKKDLTHIQRIKNEIRMIEGELND
ncbi:MULTISPECIES: class I SAM-dependent methyltransferase [unclassified Lactobacillus]|uniref:tRNA (adenine(22)-N(1))-methyltransferase n=1 Tax=unclassified Lactobacillus TaxID=2620435 RepID=UPI000EFD4E18|nr:MULTISPECIES: class I SAM-dependent methyltransferase [unclassified Lactobacillus]RMC24339.1 SAM-dependent methyltransferase [Lactobacillus sp. ESL0247]RMC28478.1 SAM-dependent methyltransferase [Lactobacillus sp. ESL0246]RMC31669.1 SAM-dependent methyltransferase [Lactobacillus sp. ESL0245]RMC48821.1 SAM-dependent methyltransferase [Lactobacillus sp. ESL0228]